MHVSYFKRFKMETDLFRLALPRDLPAGYFYVPWEDGMVDLHAQVHYQAFSDEMDAQLFTSFSDPYQCRMLLQEITTRPGFLPEATWLLGHETGCCGTLQCGSDDNSTASIQNIGIIPEHRGLGLGYIFLLQGLHCLRERGFRRVYLEVTAENTAAVQLYLKLGFRKVKTLFRAVGGIQHGFETSVW